jgi:hypothetical protein
MLVNNILKIVDYFFTNSLLKEFSNSGNNPLLYSKKNYPIAKKCLEEKERKEVQISKLKLNSF